MGQLIVRNLEDAIKEKLRQRAARRRRSLEAEVRDILRDAVARETAEGRLGSRVAQGFAGLGLATDIREWRGRPVRPIRFAR